MRFQELDACGEYDGIWACASILHVPSKELGDVLRRMEKALKTDGTIYVSFKLGTFEGIRNGRYFTDLTPKALSEVLERNCGVFISEHWVTGDARPGRESEQWLNALLRKKA